VTIACPDCGTLQDLPALRQGVRSYCGVCRGDLELTAGRSINATLACALGTFIFLFPANLLPLMSVGLLGLSRTTKLSSGVPALWDKGWPLLAILVGAFAIVLPFVRFGLLSLVLGLVRSGRRPRWLGRAFRWALELDTWAMPDVYLIAAMVGYSRVDANLPVTVHSGGYCFAAAALLCMISRAALDKRSVWRAIGPGDQAAPHGDVISCTHCDLVTSLDAEGGRCPRCAARLLARRPDAVIRTTALIIAAFVLYIPANLYPMSHSVQFGQPASYRIIDGITELIAAHLWPLAGIIFMTSIIIPLLKIIGLAWLTLSVLRGSQKHLVFKTKLYRIIDGIGRWSNVDPFIISVFVPLMSFAPFVSADAGPGADAFIMVVLLTQIASRCFDPRLMWDVASQDSA
jgi:paraquat-inducible protein A